MTLREALAACPLVAILRGLRPEEAVAVGEALVAEGLRVIEVPLNSPEPFESLRRLSARLGERAILGAGTVIEPGDAARVAEAGGRLVVTPHADPAVVRAAKAAGLIAVPGFLSPGEAFVLLAAGADALKLFPAEAASPAVLRALLAVLPRGTAVLPVGGVGEANARDWLAAGAAGLGVGSSLYRPGDGAAAVGARARALRAALAAG